MGSEIPPQPPKFLGPGLSVSILTIVKLRIAIGIRRWLSTCSDIKGYAVFSGRTTGHYARIWGSLMVSRVIYSCSEIGECVESRGEIYLFSAANTHIARSLCNQWPSSHLYNSRETFTDLLLKLLKWLTESAGIQTIVLWPITCGKSHSGSRRELRKALVPIFRISAKLLSPEFSHLG